MTKQQGILVVGGAGYIGSHCVALLLEQGHNVIVLDNLSTGHRNAVPQGATFVPGDLGNASFLDELFAKYTIDAVFHFAALSIVEESLKRPMAYYENNVNKTAVLLQAMERHDIQTFIFSSTAAVYGTPTAEIISEDHSTNPINPYGRSKLMVETMLSDAQASGKICFASLRYFNAAGADPAGSRGEDHRPETHLVPRILLSILAHEGVPLHPEANIPPWVEVYGTDYDTPDGTCVRDFIHVNDLAEAHLLALRYLETKGEPLICNLGLGKGFTVRQVIEAACQVTGVKIPIKIKPRRRGDPARLVADPSLGGPLLGWTPRFNDLEAMLETAWAWHKNHPQGYPDI